MMGFTTHVHAVSLFFLFSLLFCLRSFHTAVENLKLTFTIFILRTIRRGTLSIYECFGCVYVLFISPCAGETDFLRCSPN